MNKRSKDIFMYCLAAFIVLLNVVVFGMMCYRVVPTENIQVVTMTVGNFNALTGLVVGYYFGSSKGSADKAETLAAIPPQVP